METARTIQAFCCDAMLGGLAKWLRAAGYEASYHPGIADWDLIRLARRQQRLLLSCDTAMFKIGALRDGQIPALLIPLGLSTLQQLHHVLRKLDLVVKTPRCMVCGGALCAVEKSSVATRIPARTYAWIEQFFECERCRKVYWKGTHWARIERALQDLAALRQP